MTFTLAGRLSRLSHHWRTARDGGASVEFAIVANVFVLLMAGLCSIGVWFSVLHSLNHLAAEATRAAIAGLDSAERLARVEAYISARGDAYPFLRAADIDAAVTYPSPTTMRISVSYAVEDIPILHLLPSLGTTPAQLTAESTILVGSE